MTEELLQAVLLAGSISVGGTLVVSLLIRLWVSAAEAHAAKAEMVNLRPAELRYEVVPVNPALVAEFQRLNPQTPLLNDFVVEALDNPALAEHHTVLSADLRRSQTLHAGMTLFVKVLSLP